VSFKKPHPEQSIIEGIQGGDTTVLKTVYRDCFPMVSKLVLANSGTESEAKDLMQRVLLTLYESFQREGDFQLTSKFSTYLYGVARNLWLNEIRRKKPYFSITDTEQWEFIDTQEVEEEMIEADLYAQRHLLFWKCFEKMGTECQQLLRQYFDKADPKEIARVLGIKYESYRVKKTRCVKKLTSFVRENPHYRELK